MDWDEKFISVKALWYLPLRIAAFILRRAQALPLYRSLGRKFATCVAIAEASAVDMEKVYRHFNMTEPNFAQPPDPNVTNWVAKRGQKVVGFVELVRHLPEHHPWIGRWLFSLEVWKCYRGFGIGERLTQLVIDKTIMEGAPELLLAVFKDNARAISLYRKLGFEQVTLPALEPHLEAEKQQFGRRRIVMRKIIAKQPV